MNTSTRLRRLGQRSHAQRAAGTASPQSGETLLEVLIALVIIGISSVALLGGLVTTITSSSDHRSLATLDTLLRNFAESAKSEIQQQSNPAFTTCASTYRLVSSPSPASGPASGTAAGAVGSQVTVFVTKFDAGTTVSVTVGGQAATVTSGGTVGNTSGATNSTVTFTVPALPAQPSGPYPIVVSDTGGATANAATGFTVVPWAGSLTPQDDGPTGTQVTVPITGFAANATLTVQVGGIGATTVPAVTKADASGSQNVTFDVPAGAGAGSNSVKIFDSSGDSATARTGFYVGAGSPSSTSNANGTSTSLNLYTLGIQSVSQWISSAQAFSSTCVPPNTSGIQLITVVATAPNKVGDTLSFVVTGSTPPTTLNALSPTSGPKGSSVTITGSGFTPSAMLTIKFGTATATITSGGAVTLAGLVNAVVTVPNSLTPGTSYTVSVTDGTNTANAPGQFTVTSQTIIINPTSGPWSSAAKITGTGFLPISPLTITFNGATVTPTSGGTSLVDGSVNAVITIPTVTSGPYTVTVTDPSGNTASATYTVTKSAPMSNVVTNSGGATATLGSSVVFTATVTGQGGITPTGTETWTVAGTAGVTTCSANTGFTAVTGNTNTATCTVVLSKVGTYIVSAAYSGDGNYSALTSATDTVSVLTKYTPAVAVSGSAVGTTLTFTATVTGPTGGATPTGTMAWTGVTCSTKTGPTGASNVATYTCVINGASTTTTYTATATYPGDANYNTKAGTSAGVKG